VMFGLGPATRIYLGVDAIDMRKGFNGLYGLVRDQLGQDPLSGHLFLFTNRSRNQARFRIQIGFCNRRISLASVVREAIASLQAND
jgi:transposase